MKRAILSVLVGLILFGAGFAAAQTEESNRIAEPRIADPATLLGEWELVINGGYVTDNGDRGELYGYLSIAIDNVQQTGDWSVLTGQLNEIQNSNVVLHLFPGNYLEIFIIIYNPLFLRENPSSNIISLQCRLFIIEDELAVGIISGSFERLRRNQFFPVEFYHGSISFVRPWRIRG